MRKRNEFSLNVLASNMNICEFDSSAFCKRVKGVQKECVTHKMAMT